MSRIDELRWKCQKSKEGHEGAYYSDWSEHLPRLLSIYLTRILLKTSLTPNQITIANIIIAIGAIILLYPMQWWSYLIYVVVLFIVSVIDCCDGEVARFKELHSDTGLYLDISEMTISRSLMFFFIGVFHFWNYGELWVMASGFIASNTYLLAKALLYTKYRVITNSSLSNRMTGMPPKKKNFFSYLKFLLEVIALKAPATYLLFCLNGGVLYFKGYDSLGYILILFSIIHITAIINLLFKVVWLNSLDF